MPPQKIVFSSLLTECCRRRLPLIKMINEGRRSVDTSFYRVWVRVLVLKCRRTRLNSEVSYSGKDLIWFDEKKKKDGKPKISGSLTKKIL